MNRIKYFSQGRIAAMLSVCNVAWNSSIKWNTMVNSRDYARILKDIGIGRSDTIKKCVAQDQGYDCKIVLTEIITNMGICYTYNILDSPLMFRDEVYVVFTIKFCYRLITDFLGMKNLNIKLTNFQQNQKINSTTPRVRMFNSCIFYMIGINNLFQLKE